MNKPGVRRVSVIDSHTGGEPTRVVVAGGPHLGNGSMADRRAIFRDRHDDFRRAVITEPRGSDILIGAMLCEPHDTSCVAGVVFFNNAGVLNMCGHGTIGVAVTLAHMGRIGPGSHRLETPVGIVTITLHGPNDVTIENVPSYRIAKQVPLAVPELGTIHGDVVWGGNWFFLVSDHGQKIVPSNIERLLAVTRSIKRELVAQGVTGEAGAEIDHLELFGPPTVAGADSKSFVLCPGGEYDRSPCGTGTSAKLASLVADGKLTEGTTWRQESIVGSLFEGTVRIEDGKVIPRIRGSAYVNAEATLLLDPDDPFMMGIRS
jgi:4-hydroxyproline epimerase